MRLIWQSESRERIDNGLLTRNEKTSSVKLSTKSCSTLLNQFHALLENDVDAATAAVVDVVGVGDVMGNLRPV